MDALDLARERDALLQLGRTVEEVDRMQRHADVDVFDALKRLSKLLERTLEGDGIHSTFIRDHACRVCMADFMEKHLVRPDWLCARHHALKLISLPESETGASMPHSPGGGT